MDMIVDVINSIDAFVWGPPMLVLLLGSHIFLTFRTGFIQRKLPTAIKLSVTKDPDAPGDISQFGALCHGAVGHHRHRQHRRRGHSHHRGRPGRGVLDVDHRRVRHCHEVLRDLRRREVPREGPQRRHARRRHVRVEARLHRQGRQDAVVGAARAPGPSPLFAAIASFGIGSAVQSSAMTEVIIARTCPACPPGASGLPSSSWCRSSSSAA